MKTPKKLKKFNAAFTMVELLVVIAIVAVLASLLFLLVSRMRVKASSAISTVNLRQIGTAIASYTVDNNSTLPGPVLTDHFPRYQNNAVSGQLGWLLRDFLPAAPQPDNPQPRMFYTAVLDYPAAKNDPKNPQSRNRPTYVVFSKQTDVLTKATFWPMGNYNPNSSGEKTPPMTTAQLAGRETRGNPWITEIDQIIRPSTASYGASAEPPHGKFRNTLMFDYSVKAVPIREFDTK
ncbi:type II secretion system protein [bacterium]|nr:type II secretion system protein [bacterium]